MKRRIIRLLRNLFRLSLFCGYFYVLFVNLVCGFSAGGAETRLEAAVIFVCASAIAAGFPGMIWYQSNYIKKLEKALEEAENFQEHLAERLAAAEQESRGKKASVLR